MKNKPNTTNQMPNHYDVIIVGAGPAGLRCAEILAAENKKVLLLEKGKQIGDKVCAAGLTRKSLELMEIPQSLFEYEIKTAVIRSSKQIHTTRIPGEPFVFMIDRIEFGQWQADKLKKTSVVINTESRVTSVNNNKVTTSKNEVFTFDFLVGADGANSFVRRHLGLSVKKKLVSLQYKIPGKYQEAIEIHLNSSHFYSGYAWIFPHKNYLTVGCSVNPQKFPVQELKRGFQQWLDNNNLDVSKAKFESFPINYDFQGFRFDNTFLVGEAAGLASGLTGEGIYQALVSGEEIAKIILNPDYESEPMKEIIRYNEIQLKILRIFNASGIFREALFNLILKLFKSKFINKRITNGFS